MIDQELINIFIDSANDLNKFICGLNKGEIEFNKNRLHGWDKKKIKAFIREMNKVSTFLDKEIILYRGTRKYASPIMKDFAPELINCHYLSTSRSESIANRFMRATRTQVGYLHILRCQPGVRFLDMEPYYKDSSQPGLSEEEEIILSPGCTLFLLGMTPIEFVDDNKNYTVKKWKVEWLVKP